MLEKDPETWGQVTWVLLLSSAVIAYLARLLDKIKSQRVKSFVIETLEFVICIGIAFGVYLTSTFFALDERLVWLCSVYLAHKGTRYIFARLDLAADIYLKRMTGDKNVKDSGSDNS